MFWSGGLRNLASSSHHGRISEKSQNVLLHTCDGLGWVGSSVINTCSVPFAASVRHAAKHALAGL